MKTRNNTPEKEEAQGSNHAKLTKSFKLDLLASTKSNSDIRASLLKPNSPLLKFGEFSGHPAKKLSTFPQSILALDSPLIKLKTVTSASSSGRPSLVKPFFKEKTTLTNDHPFCLLKQAPSLIKKEETASAVVVSHLQPKSFASSSSSSSQMEISPETKRNVSASYANRKKKSEKDLLYDALHEIKWAQHFTPTFVLAKKAKRDVERKDYSYKKNLKYTITKKEPKVDLLSKAKQNIVKKINLKYSKNNNKQKLLKNDKNPMLISSLKRKNTSELNGPNKKVKLAGDNCDITKTKTKVHIKINNNNAQPTELKKSSKKSKMGEQLVNNNSITVEQNGNSVPQWHYDLKAKMATTKKNNEETIVIKGNKMGLKINEDKMNNNNNKKKKEMNPESVRVSIRQSECHSRFKDIAIRKYDTYHHIVLIQNRGRQNSLTINGMRELKEALDTAFKDATCRAVLLSSGGNIFCSGLDLRPLISTNKKKDALEMATSLKELALTLSRFTKPLVAAVNGVTIGFGVTLLTYCDVVLASDKATFVMPYSQLGYIPEGAATFILPQVVGFTLASDMLLRSNQLTAEQAHQCGLVTELVWPAKFMEQVIPRMVKLASQSFWVMQATKIMVRRHMLEKFESTLDYEVSILPQQWLSPECQSNITKAIKEWMFIH